MFLAQFNSPQMPVNPVIETDMKDDTVELAKRGKNSYRVST